MKKLLIQPSILMIAALSLLVTSCNPKEGDGTTGKDTPIVQVQIVGEPTATEVTVKVVPEKGTVKYRFALGAAEDEATFLANAMAGTEEVVGDVEKTKTFDELIPSTKYFLYAIGENAAGEQGPLTARLVKTYTDDFLVELYYVSDNSAGFSIVNTNDYYQYSYALGSPADKQKFEDNELDGTVTKPELFDWCANYFDLTPETEYVFYVRGYDRAGGMTKTFEIPITTYAVGSDKIPNFTFENGETNCLVQNYILTPNDKCGQIVLHQQLKGAQDAIFFGENNWKGKLLEMFDTWKDMSGANSTMCYTATGEVLKAMPYTMEMEFNQELDVYVVAYDAALKPFFVKKFKNTTPGLDATAGTSVAGDFTITVTDAMAGSVTTQITHTSDNVMAYYYDIVDAAYYDSEVAGNSDPYFMHNKLVGGPVVYNTRDYTDTYTGDDVKANTRYYLVVCPFNVNGPRTDGWGELAKVEFTTAAE